MVIEDNKILKSMQEGTSQILQPLMNKKCLRLYVGILFTGVTGSLLKCIKNRELRSTTTITKHEVQWENLLHENSIISFGDNPNQIFILQNTRSKPTGKKSHLPEEHILDLLLLLLTKKNNKMFQFSILASKGNFDSFAYSCKH